MHWQGTEEHQKEPTQVLCHFDSYYVLSLARSICALLDGSVGCTKCKELGQHTHLAHVELHRAAACTTSS